MKNWSERPIELTNLLNPAFCGEIIRRCCLKYQEKNAAGCPILLVYLILPLINDLEIRSSIPTNSAPNLHGWLVDHPEFQIRLSQKIKQMKPFTNEAILFLTRCKVIQINRGCVDVVITNRSSITKWRDNRHPHNFFKKSEKLGAWFSGAGGVSSVYSILGVRP